MRNNRGGDFNFTGGTLAVAQFDGDLVQQGGTLAAGASPGTMTINGDYTLEEPGTLEVELAADATPGTGYDQYLISGDATLAGKLKVVLLNGFLPTLGDSFQFLTRSGTLTSMFDELQLPNLSGGLGWRLTAGAHALSLDVVDSLDGDFNHDNVVDAADYTVWRDGLGSAYTIDDYALVEGTLWSTRRWWQPVEFAERDSRAQCFRAGSSDTCRNSAALPPIAPNAEAAAPVIATSATLHPQAFGLGRVSAPMLECASSQ